MQDLLLPGDKIGNIRYLEDNADEILEEYSYQKVLSEEDIELERINFANIAIELQQIEETAKMIAEEYREKIKKKKDLYNKSLTLIRVGRMEVTGTVYLIKDINEGKIGTYDQDGVLIGQKPLSQKERQGRLFNQNPVYISRTGTNNEF